MTGNDPERQPPNESPRERAAPVALSSRQIRLLVAAMILAAFAATFWPRGEKSEAPGGFLFDAEGRPQPLGAVLAPVTLVHFWATWCPPCLSEVPALDRLRTAFADRHDFAVVMVAVADDRQKVRSFLGARADGTLFDPNWNVANRYGTKQLPETYLLVSGSVVDKWEGSANWDDPAVRARITRVLR